MTSGSILPQMIRFALPLIVGMVFQQLYNTVDAVIVGRFVGTSALAAVNGTVSITNMVLSLCNGLSTGATVVIAQCYGSGDDHKVLLAVHTIISMTFLLGVFSMGIGLALVNPMLRLMSTPDSVYQEAFRYITIYYFGIFFLFIYNMGSGILRAVGDSRRPLLFLIFSSAFNILFDLLFVAVFHWGVEGAAWATVMAEFLSAALVLFVLTAEPKAYGLRWKKLCLNKDMAVRVIKIGLPAAVQQLITCFSNVFVQSYINYFDAVTMAAWGCYLKVDRLIFIAQSAIGTTVNTFVGQNFGAEQRRRAKQGVHVALVLCLAVTTSLSLLCMAFAETVMSLFTEDAGVIAKGAMFIRAITPFYLVHVFYEIYASALRGINLSTVPAVFSLLSFVAIRQVYLFIISRVCNTEIAIGMGYPLGWFFASLFLAIYFYSCPYFRREKKLSPSR